jgi:arylsulfatase A-like enzyme
MRRREFLLAGAAAAAPVHAAPSRPNFIIILTDDHGYHDLHCAGATDLKTPHLDALAASGARFTDWYSNAPMCAPSRAAIMTGRYPYRCNVYGNSPVMPASEVTIAHIMKAQGYATGVFGKWHLGETEGHPNARGFDEFFGFHTCNDHFSHRNYWFAANGLSYHDLWHNRTEVWEEGRYSTEMWTDKAVEWLEANRARPFFLYLPYSAVHYPMHAPRKYLERCADIADPERQVYAAMLACVDDGVGRIVEFLDKNGLRENTFIAFTSDNGATRETRSGRNRQPGKGGVNLPHRGAKFSLFDGGIRVPAAMSWPARIPPRQVVKEMVMSADLFPTFTAAAGGALPADRTIDGRDILPVVANRAATPHKEMFWGGPSGQAAVRRGKWKYIRNPIEADGTDRGMKPLGGEDTQYLADLSEDPGEAKNLKRVMPDLANELDRSVGAWLEDVKKP